MDVLNINPKKPKMKPILGKIITFRCSVTSNLTYITKSRPKMLSTIELVSLESNQPNFKNIRTICKALKDAKKASSFIIKKDDSKKQNFKQLKHLFNNTHRHWRKLVVTYINSDGDDHLLFQETAEILTRFRRFRDLSRLEVFLCCTKDIKDHILFHLLQQLKGLRNLKALKLDLSGCRDREELPRGYEPNAPIFQFKFLRSLEYLSLALQRTEFLDQKMLSAFATNLSRCNSLIHLNLDFDLNNLRPFDVKALAPLFKKVQSLKSFKMNPLFHPRLQLEESLNFIKSFEYMRPIIRLELSIFFCLPEETCVIFTKNLFKYLASLINLRSLRLHISVKKFSSNNNDPDEQNLFLPLQSLINLQALHLSLQCRKDKELPSLQSLSRAIQSFRYFENFALFLGNIVRRSHIISLSHLFKNLTSLQKLYLIFYDADLEADSLQLLSTSISHLKLSSFTFNFRDHESGLQPNKTQIWKHQKELPSFFSALSHFKSLLSLRLHLSVFDFLTKELQSLALVLKEMKQLCRFSLELPKLPPDRRFKGLQNILSSLKEMSQLAILQLIFQGNKLCDEEVELVSSSLAECGRSVETLILKFPETQELKDRSVLALQDGLRTLFSLKDLTLVLGKKNVFHVEAVNRLFEALSFLKNLETVTMELPPAVVPLGFENILRKFAGHWNLKTFTVNQTSWLKSVDQNQH